MSLQPIGMLNGMSVVYPVKVPYSALCELGFSSTGPMATDATMALGWKPTVVDTAYPLCDPTHHYLLTIRKAGTTVTVWKQDVELGGYTTAATTYAELLAEALTVFAGAAKGYLSRLVVAESALDYTAFYRQSPAVPGLWVPRDLAELTVAVRTLLEFANAADLGMDSSGNGHDWTLPDATQSTDTPTNNGCTLHPLDPATVGSLSDGNLTTTDAARVTLRPASGKWYYEKDGVGVSYDADASGPFNPSLTAGTYNFGATPWAGAGPGVDEAPLMDAWLPEPALYDVNEHYLIATLNTPTAAAQDVVAGFNVENNDWVLYLKDSVSSSPLFISSVSGLNINMPITGTTVVTMTESVIENGNTLTLPAELFTAGHTYSVLLMRSGPETGVYVRSYTGTGVAQDIPHGLGQTPPAMFVKCVSRADHWMWYSENLGPGKYMVMETQTGPATNATVWDGTSPDADSFRVGTSTSTNSAGDTFVAVAFANTDFVRFATYVGNGSVNGPVIYNGGTAAAIPYLFRMSATNRFTFAVPFKNAVGDYWFLNRNSATATAAMSAAMSNGFKMITTHTHLNVSGDSFIAISLTGQNKYRNAF